MSGLCMGFRSSTMLSSVVNSICNRLCKLASSSVPFRFGGEVLFGSSKGTSRTPNNGGFGLGRLLNSSYSPYTGDGDREREVL